MSTGFYEAFAHPGGLGGAETPVRHPRRSGTGFVPGNVRHSFFPASTSASLERKLPRHAEKPLDGKLKLPVPRLSGRFGRTIWQQVAVESESRLLRMHQPFSMGQIITGQQKRAGQA